MIDIDDEEEEDVVNINKGKDLQVLHKNQKS